MEYHSEIQRNLYATTRINLEKYTKWKNYWWRVSWSYLHEMSRKDKCIETEGRIMAAWVLAV